MSLDDDDDVIQATFFSRMASCGTQFSVSYPLSSSVGKKGNKRNGKKKNNCTFQAKSVPAGTSLGYKTLEKNDFCLLHTRYKRFSSTLPAGL